MASQSTVIGAKAREYLLVHRSLNQLNKRIRRFRIRKGLSLKEYFKRFPRQEKKIFALRGLRLVLTDDLSDSESRQKLIKSNEKYNDLLSKSKVIREKSIKFRKERDEARSLNKRIKEKMGKHLKLLNAPKDVIIEVLNDPLPSPPVPPTMVPIDEIGFLQIFKICCTKIKGLLLPLLIVSLLPIWIHFVKDFAKTCEPSLLLELVQREFHDLRSKHFWEMVGEAPADKFNVEFAKVGQEYIIPCQDHIEKTFSITVTIILLSTGISLILYLKNFNTKGKKN
jgi:hypothetical protein